LGQFLRATEAAKVRPGTMLGVDVGGRRILLSNIGGEIFAVDATCTHEEFDLSQGFMVEERVVCALHLSQFDLRTGEVSNPPATEPLRIYNVKIEEEAVFVEI